MNDIDVIRLIEAKLGVMLPELGTASNANFDESNDYRISDAIYYCTNAEDEVIEFSLPNFSIKNLQSLVDDLIRLKRLITLRLSGDKIYDINPLRKLKHLKTLYLNNNYINDIQPISGLKKLVELDLTNNNIDKLNNIKSLISLEKLFLSKNNIENISELQGMTHLNALVMHDNRINDIAPVSTLVNLKGLGLINNRISDLMALKNLKLLSEVGLEGNLIDNISPLSDLTQLIKVNLSNNLIRDISSLKGLVNLSALNLSINYIEYLPEWICDFKMKITFDKEDHEINTLNVFGNPIKNPPIEIIVQGKEAIKRYFEQVEKEGIDYLYETKLILVGEGSAGKTSLQARLMNELADLPKQENRTRGIKIENWTFKKEGEINHIAHIWDFGGQDVYYPVHRFFLTENSVFVLLASTRQTHHNFDYWIPTIYQFGGSSPIILGQTCHDGNKAPWNYLGYYVGSHIFNIIKTKVLPYYELNLPNGNQGLGDIKQAIVEQLMSLPHYGKGVPKSWVTVRELLQKEVEKKACISFEGFINLCKETNPVAFKDFQVISDLAKFLHSIGVILWYSENEELKDWVILQPEWAMNAVYKIIDDEKIMGNNGIIHIKDFERLWHDDCYFEKYKILKKMLEEFKIAFPKKFPKGDYLIPARLLTMPAEARWQAKATYLRLEYTYDFMPRGMVNQLTAELSRFILDDRQVWNNAVRLESEDKSAQCHIEEDFYFRKISILATGKDARGLIIRVMEALKDIADGYKGVKANIKVPCICSLCSNSINPYQFPYDLLIRKTGRKENATVTCIESDVVLLIDELLHNVGLPNPVKEEKERNNSKKINLFLASSSELIEDRDSFEQFIARENQRLYEKGIFINLIRWECFVDAMSKVGLQSEYNKAISESDIFVSLFFTKVGRYTAEEFEVAFKQFQSNNKPFVYTYFKQGKIDVNTSSKDVKSKEKFQKRLTELKHYQSNYNNIDDLQNKFRYQLDIILPKLTLFPPF